LDIAQEVFVKAYYAIETYNNAFRFSTWLYRIARNTAIDSLRKKQLNVRSLDEPQTLKDGAAALPTEDDSRRRHNGVRAAVPRGAIAAQEYASDHLGTSTSVRTWDRRICEIPIGTVKNRIVGRRKRAKSWRARSANPICTELNAIQYIEGIETEMLQMEKMPTAPPTPAAAQHRLVRTSHPRLRHPAAMISPPALSRSSYPVPRDQQGRRPPPRPRHPAALGLFSTAGAQARPENPVARWWNSIFLRAFPW
jgi:hypothetical protein